MEKEKCSGTKMEFLSIDKSIGQRLWSLRLSAALPAGEGMKAS